MTENGLIRIMSARSYPGGAVSLPVLVRVLSALKASNHLFVADDVSLTDDARFDFGHFQGHSQLTDAYLLALAVKHRLRFATFDMRINPAIITGGARALEVIPVN